MASPRIAVVIPAYKVTAHIADVIRAVGKEVSDIIVVDDACPESSGEAAKKEKDRRVIVHPKNLGVEGPRRPAINAPLESERISS